MKAMQGGMGMMREMQAMVAGSGTGGMGMMGSPSGAAPMAGTGDGKAMPDDMAKRHQMMIDHMALSKPRWEAVSYEDTAVCDLHAALGGAYSE